MYNQINNIASSNEEKKEEILLEIIEYGEKQIKLNQIQMDKEINEISIHLMKELEDAKDEIKMSYAEDMKEIDGIHYFNLETVFPDLFNGMKEDLENDLINITEKYEDQKFFEIQKIKIKFSKLLE